MIKTVCSSDISSPLTGPEESPVIQEHALDTHSDRHHSTMEPVENQISGDVESGDTRGESGDTRGEVEMDAEDMGVENHHYTEVLEETKSLSQHPCFFQGRQRVLISVK